MSPDLEWQIENESDHQTIDLTPRPPHWHRLGVLIAAVLGAAVGVIYSSLPEPSPVRVVPTETPAPMSDTLVGAIRRDAEALAGSAGTRLFQLNLAGANNDVSGSAFARWYQSLLAAGGRWGIVPSSQLFTIEHTGTVSSGVMWQDIRRYRGVVWVDIRQFRREGYFRQTRFYRQIDGRWQWALPDPLAWSHETRQMSTAVLGHALPFEIVYPPEEESYVGVVAERFEQALQDLCASLNCPPDSVPALQVIVLPGLTTSHHVSAHGGAVVVRIPSPRVIGFYESPAAPGDPITSMAYDALIRPVVRAASGDARRWDQDESGWLFLQAVVDWKWVQVKQTKSPSGLFYSSEYERAEILTPPGVMSTQAFYRSRLADGELLPLADLWQRSPNVHAFAGWDGRAAVEAASLVAFIEDVHGQEWVVKFLNALGAADSLEAAIEQALSAPYGDVERQWLDWIGR